MADKERSRNASESDDGQTGNVENISSKTPSESIETPALSGETLNGDDEKCDSISSIGQSSLRVESSDLSRKSCLSPSQAKGTHFDVSIRSRSGKATRFSDSDKDYIPFSNDKRRKDSENSDDSPAIEVRNPSVKQDGSPKCEKLNDFLVDVVVQECKSESDVIDADNDADICPNGDLDSEGGVVPKLTSSLNAASSRTARPKISRKSARSRSWCARSGDDGLSVADIRLLRERLLRTQSHPQPTAIRGFTGAQKLTLASLALVDFMSFCSMSIMAPFFPREASEKGMTDSVSGFVFSFYALVMFITSPFFGKILPTVGAKFLLLSGIFVAGSCNLLFGVLEYIYDYNTFTTFCFLIRGLEALGASAYSTASYVFVVNTFPNNIGSVLGILETFIGLGMSVGPAIGGLLYSVGGFGLPFYVLGVAMVVTMPINYLLLPNQEDYSVSSQSGSLLELVKVPAVVITGLVIVVVSNTWAFLDPTLEPHLRQFDLSAEQVGLIFLLFSGLYGLFSPVWGYLADRVDRHWCMMVWGLLLCTVGLLLLGPSPLLPFLESSLWLNLVGLSIIGISVALTLLPTFQGVLTSSIEEGGCGDNLGTYSIVAGVWSCMYSLGEVIGPSLGGVLLKNFGFPICSTVMAALTFILALVTLTFFTMKEATKLSTESSDSFSESTSPPSWGTGGSALEQVLDEGHPLLSSQDSGSGRKGRQSYGGTGITTKHGKEMNQNQQNIDKINQASTCSFKLRNLFKSKPKTKPSNSEESDGTQSDEPTTIEGLRALIQSEFYQKYLDDSFMKMEASDCNKSDVFKENPFIWDRNVTEDSLQFKKNESGLLPRLGEPPVKGPSRRASTDLHNYNKDKVRYYKESRMDDCDDLILDRHQVTDVRGTVNITSSGACEV